MSFAAVLCLYCLHSCHPLLILLCALLFTLIDISLMILCRFKFISLLLLLIAERFFLLCQIYLVYCALYSFHCSNASFTLRFCCTFFFVFLAYCFIINNSIFQFIHYGIMFCIFNIMLIR